MKKKKKKGEKERGEKKKREETFTKLIVIPHNHNEEWNDRTTFHDPFPEPSARVQETKVQDEQGSRHRGTIMGMDGDGVGGTQELSLKESKRRRMGKREDTKKDGHQVGRLLLPTPTLYISLLLPATSSVFQFERRTACTKPKRSSSCTGSRSLGRWLAETEADGGRMFGRVRASFFTLVRASYTKDQYEAVRPTSFSFFLFSSFFFFLFLFFFFFFFFFFSFLNFFVLFYSSSNSFSF